MPISIRVEEPWDAIRIVYVSGRLDNDTVAEFTSAMVGVFESAIKTLVLDFGELRYISSVGIRAIYNVQKDMKARKGECYFVSLQPPVKRVFEIVRAVEIESVFASTQELDDYLAKIQRDIAQTDEKSAN